jgi:UDP-N-acetylglucosamine/UDP-N-acetylgalactosamine diphosphorylase
MSDIHKILESKGQDHVLKFYDTLDQKGRAKLMSQIEGLDIDDINRLAETYVKNKPAVSIPQNIQSVDVYPRTSNPEHAKLYTQAHERGKELVKHGKVGVLLVAGGQGTRLGYDSPKGTFCVTPIKKKTLFQVFAEQLIAHSRNSKSLIPWYIMTSEINSETTKEFFKENNYFGYNPANIFFFEQGLMPAFDMNGKLLLAEQDSLALSPDGHGGCLMALKKSGALADMHKRGIEHLSYFQVDNPLVHCIDYTYLGLHDLLKSEMSSKTVAKAGPLEKVGNFAKVNGKTQVIEYSDLPEEIVTKTNPDGTYVFNAGSIAIHALRVSFIDKLTNGELSLPWHRAEKKVDCINDAGELIKPESPNAVKLEQFIFDAIPLAKNALVYQTDRAEEFSPVKNADGVDSPATCRQHQINRAARWLEQAGISVPMKDGIPDAVLEIDPLFAVSSEELISKKLSIKTIPAHATVYFGVEGIEGLDLEKNQTLGVFKRLGSTAQRLFGSRQNQAA